MGPRDLIPRYGSDYEKQLLAEEQGTAAYKAALERALYGQASELYGQGIAGITSALAGGGPLADSGAATALRARLFSQIYGAAKNRSLQSYSDYLANYLSQQRQFNYQKQLMKYQRDVNRPTFWDYLSGAAGGAAGAAF